MSYYEQIDDLKQQYNEQLEIKADSRMEFTKLFVILSTLASELSPLKNTASIDNKINSLLALDDEEMASKCRLYFQAMKEHEIMYKNARDKIGYLECCIKEYQNRRWCEKEIKN